MKISEILYEGKVPGRWVKTKGPNNTPGFNLQQKVNGKWSTLGFVKQIPKRTSGMITAYNGMTDIDVDLDALVMTGDDK